METPETVTWTPEANICSPLTPEQKSPRRHIRHILPVIQYPWSEADIKTGSSSVGFEVEIQSDSQATVIRYAI